jgi:hypothetical protein
MKNLGIWVNRPVRGGGSTIPTGDSNCGNGGLGRAIIRWLA